MHASGVMLTGRQTDMFEYRGLFRATTRRVHSVQLMCASSNVLRRAPISDWSFSTFSAMHGVEPYTLVN